MAEKAVILYNKISENPTTDELDVLEQVKDVNGALTKIGYETGVVQFSFDIETAIKEIKALNPKFIFNLVEGIDNDGQLIAIAPTVFDYLKIPYAGCSKETIFITSDKVLTKKFLQLNGIPTAQWVTLEDEQDNVFLDGERYIVKAIWEDASIGLDEDAVVSPKSKEDLLNIIQTKSNKYQIKFFAERYIHGRDFTISLLAGKQMPVCEIIFFGHYDKEGQVKVFDYNAKWVKDTPEYDNTDIDFDFTGVSDETIEKMQKIANDCWDIFNLKGWARIDFRVDENGNPFVLEINPNPCISRGIMYDKTLQRGKIDYVDAINIIVNDIRGLNGK